MRGKNDLLYQWSAFDAQRVLKIHVKDSDLLIFKDHLFLVFGSMKFFTYNSIFLLQPFYPDSHNHFIEIVTVWAIKSTEKWNASWVHPESCLHALLGVHLKAARTEEHKANFAHSLPHFWKTFSKKCIEAIIHSLLVWDLEMIRITSRKIIWWETKAWNNWRIGVRCWMEFGGFSRAISTLSNN